MRPERNQRSPACLGRALRPDARTRTARQPARPWLITIASVSTIITTTVIHETMLYQRELV